MSNASYIIERHPHGWLLKSPEFKRGIPMEALSESRPLFPKGAGMWPGISNALNAVMAIATDSEGRAWEREITEELERQQIPTGLKWLRGVDIGLSSRAIFYHLTDNIEHKGEAEIHGEVPTSTPADYSDFGRCSRLLSKMGWGLRITEMATALPHTSWPNLVAAWPELEEMFRLGKRIELSARIRELSK